MGEVPIPKLTLVVVEQRVVKELAKMVAKEIRMVEMVKMVHHLKTEMDRMVHHLRVVRVKARTGSNKMVVLQMDKDSSKTVVLQMDKDSNKMVVLQMDKANVEVQEVEDHAVMAVSEVEATSVILIDKTFISFDQNWN